MATHRCCQGLSTGTLTRLLPQPRQAPLLGCCHSLSGQAPLLGCCHSLWTGTLTRLLPQPRDSPKIHGPVSALNLHSVHFACCWHHYQSSVASCVLQAEVPHRTQQAYPILRPVADASRLRRLRLCTVAAGWRRWLAPATPPILSAESPTPVCTTERCPTQLLPTRLLSVRVQQSPNSSRQGRSTASIRWLCWPLLPLPGSLPATRRSVPMVSVPWRSSCYSSCLHCRGIRSCVVVGHPADDIGRCGVHVASST